LAFRLHTFSAVKLQTYNKSKELLLIVMLNYLRHTRTGIDIDIIVDKTVQLKKGNIYRYHCFFFTELSFYLKTYIKGLQYIGYLSEIIMLQKRS
jgi:hypothetical protein